MLALSFKKDRTKLFGVIKCTGTRENELNVQIKCKLTVFNDRKVKNTQSTRAFGVKKDKKNGFHKKMQQLTDVIGADSNADSELTTR